MSDTQTNIFTDGPLGAIYLKPAIPVIFASGIGGFLTAADTPFLGQSISAKARENVRLLLPIYRLIVALLSLISMFHPSTGEKL